MKWRRPLGIRGKIAAVILLCMIPVLILGVLLFQYRNQGRLDIVQQSHREAARAIASDIETFVSSAVEAERTAGAAVTGQPYPVVGIIQLFTAIRANNPFFLSLALLDPAGRVVAASPPGAGRLDLSTHPALKAIRAGKAWAAGPTIWKGDRPTLELATGIRQGANLTAVVLGRLDLGRFPALLPHAPFTSADDPGVQTDAIIVDADGRVIFDLRRPDRNPRAFGEVGAVRAALGGREASIPRYWDARSRAHYLGAAAPIPDLGWAAIIIEPETSALESARRQATRELIALLAAVGVGLCLAWVLGSELSAPILALVRGARAIGRGELGTRVTLRRTDELGELGEAFNEMTQRLSQYVGEMNALQAVSDAALSTVHLNELLPPLVRQLVAALHADGGRIWFVEERTGDLLLPAGFEGASADNTQRLARGRGLAGRVAADARSLVISDPVRLAMFEPDLLAKGACATVGVPLRAGGRVIGVAQVFSRRPREFTAHEVRLLEAFADRVALAVDNATAYERQREIAEVIQQTLLPQERVSLSGLTVAGRYLPSREVGGDFYAVFPLNGQRAGLVIADVSGKGIPAATLSARARYLLEAFALDGRPPGAVLTQLNHVLSADADSKFVSLFYAVLDPRGGTLAFASAGHLPPLLLRAGEASPVFLETRGILLGVEPSATYATTEMWIAPGDLLVMFTDGITEARNPHGEQFGEQRLAALLAASAGVSPEEVADRIMAAVTSWCGKGTTDDQTVVAAQILDAH
jgi:serine phosphatase RsbU (regulator of sigma subunit)/HAMP domain-containing protein